LLTCKLIDIFGNLYNQAVCNTIVKRAEFKEEKGKLTN